MPEPTRQEIREKALARARAEHPEVQEQVRQMRDNRRWFRHNASEIDHHKLALETKCL